MALALFVAIAPAFAADKTKVDAFIVELQTHPLPANRFDHLSLRITRGRDGAFVSTVGAGPQVAAGTTDKLLLVEELNRPNDVLSLNGRRIVLTKPAQYETTTGWVLDLIIKAESYCDCLNYVRFPEYAAGPGYSSNSFIAGLLDATGSVISHPDSLFDETDHPGWETPVPRDYYGF
jgi:hypothetical protein